MKRTLIKWIGITVMAGAITFSLIQVRIPVVRADGCPTNPWPECLCDLSWFTEADYGGQTVTTCHYHCACGPGNGGGDFLIERDYSYSQ